MSTPRGDKGKKGSFGKKCFSKTAPLSRPRTPKQPQSSRSTNPRIVRSNTKKSDQNFSFLPNEYEIKEVFYQDANETILIVQKKSKKKTYLAKICNQLQSKYQEYYLYQIPILIGFQHPTIAHFYGFSYNDFENKGHITYLISHCKCNLSSFLYDKTNKTNFQSYQSTDRQITLIGIARGMHLLHQRCIIHKRLNASNVYLNKYNHPKILGFCCTKSEQDFYSAPETILNNVYSTKTDVYSFGILMYEILSSCKAYSKNKVDPKLIKIKVANENYRPVISFKIKKSLKNLMIQCWSADPNQRPDFKEIFERLCKLDGDDDNSRPKLPPLKKDDDSDPKEEPNVSYCIDDTVDKDAVKLYIQKVLVDSKPANLDKNNDDDNDDDDNDKQISHLTENNQSPNLVPIKVDMNTNPEKHKKTDEIKQTQSDPNLEKYKKFDEIKQTSSDQDLLSSNSNIDIDLIENTSVWQKNFNCCKCEQLTDENDRVYYSGCLYHKHCVKCMSCQKVFDSTSKLQDFVCITKGLFLCIQHYNEYQSSKQLSEANFDEYHKQNKKNFVKEIFDSPLLSTEIINNVQDDDDFITPNIIEDAIPHNLPYDTFIPTVTLKFDILPNEIDFSNLDELIGDEIVILNVEKGCTFLKIAFLQIKKLGKKIFEKVQNFANDIRTKLKSTVGKSVIGNLVEEPLINIPDNKKIQEEYNKPSLNLLQNTYELNEIELEDIKEEVLSNLHKEKTKKNWSFLFNHEDIFKQIEEQIRKDIKNNEFEMIIVAQTVIANRNIEEFEKIKNHIPANQRKVAYLYHGTKLAYHQNIVKEHFWMPGQDDMTHYLDSGYYGKGIYSTENLFYASMYANGYNILNFNQKTHIFCCLSVYDTMHVGECVDMSHCGKKIEPEIINNYGINHATVGSSTGFHPIKSADYANNYLMAEEFVFPNKYQIIPIYSFTVMRKDHFILWKDDNIDNSENSRYFNDLSKRMEVNVYKENSVNDALNLIKRKKKNMFKLITNASKDLNGKELIDEARKIIGANFVCLVFASNIDHYGWIKEMENVLFTVNPADFKRFCEIGLNEKEILEFVSRLEGSSGFKFKINKNDLLRFPTASKSYYKG